MGCRQRPPSILWFGGRSSSIVVLTTSLTANLLSLYFRQVNLLYPNKKPADGIPVSISVTGTSVAGKEIKIGEKAITRHDVNFEDTTDDQGRANFVIDTPGNIKKMKIRVSWGCHKGQILNGC